MTDIIRMAREAGLWLDADGVITGGDLNSIIPFAKLVAAAERDRACRIVTGLCISDNNAREINAAIRGHA